MNQEDNSIMDVTSSTLSNNYNYKHTRSWGSLSIHKWSIIRNTLNLSQY